MFKNARRRGLIGRLLAAGLDSESATAVTAAIYPGADFAPPKRPNASKASIIDAVEAFIAHRITGEALFQEVFGQAQRVVLGFPEMPPESAEPAPVAEREEVAYEGEMANYSGRCQNCGTADRPVYPGWRMMDLGVWACEPCISNRQGDNRPILELVGRYQAGEVDIVLAQGENWVRLTELHRHPKEAIVEEDATKSIGLWKDQLYRAVANQESKDLPTMGDGSAAGRLPFADAATLLDLLERAKFGLEVGALSEDEHRTIKDRLLSESPLTGESLGVDLEADSSACPACGAVPVIRLETGYYECTHCGEELGLTPSKQRTNGYDGPLFYVPGFPYTGDSQRFARFVDGYHRVLVDSSIVPSAHATWPEVRRFALSFNAQSELLFSSADSDVADGRGYLVALRDSAYDDWTTGSGVSEDLTLLELRRILYMMAEFHIWEGSDPDETGYEEFIGGLLEAIRDRVGSDRALDPNPLTPGEQFARFTLDLAQAIQPVNTG